MPIKQLVTDHSVDLSTLTQRYDITEVSVPTEDMILRVSDGVVSLAFPTTKQGDVAVDFCSAASEYRRLHGGGYGQPIAKALSLSPKFQPAILDMTAGLGRDAFVMASLGARVTLFERHPIVACLLENGLKRAQESNSPAATVCQRMNLILGDSAERLAGSDRFDMVYLDPMFPSRSKSAAVKKDMAAFHELVGHDQDADKLLDIALDHAEYRVVVKRPKNAPFLADKSPSVSHKGKAGRFDIYSKRAIKQSEFISVVADE
jgi:16S rRNA (guanine1516-N2)-methyltransferase